MRRIVFVLTALNLMVAAAALAGTVEANDPDLLPSYRHGERVLWTEAQRPDVHQILSAPNLAAAETRTIDGLRLVKAPRQLSALAAYVVVSDTMYTWNGSTWDYQSRTTYAYGAGDRLSQSVTEEYVGGVWVNSGKEIMTYDGGYPQTTTWQVWESEQWVNEGMGTYTYQAGKLTETLIQEWDGGAWVNTFMTTYTYDDATLTQTHSKIWLTGAWANQSRSTHSYDGSNLTQTLTESWNGGAWVNAFKSDYSYDGGDHQILDVYSLWQGVDWGIFDIDTSKWDSGFLVEEVHVGVLIPSLSRSQYSYDGNSNLTVELDQTWTVSEWVNAARTINVYDEGMAVRIEDAQLPATFELEQNYPNPFNPTTVVRYTVYRATQVEIAVFNLLGQEIIRLEDSFQRAGVYETTWNGTDQAGRPVASGVYFYRVQADDFNETRKMMLLK